MPRVRLIIPHPLTSCLLVRPALIRYSGPGRLALLSAVLASALFSDCGAGVILYRTGNAHIQPLPIRTTGRTVALILSSHEWHSPQGEDPTG